MGESPLSNMYFALLSRASRYPKGMFWLLHIMLILIRLVLSIYLVSFACRRISSAD